MFGRAKHIRDAAGNTFDGNGVAVIDRDSTASKIESRVDRSLINADSIAEYRRTCEEIGLDPSDIMVEEFRHFLAGKDLPTFKLSEVVAYMDALVAKDNPTRLGWHWCPVRPKDAEMKITFGRPAEVEVVETRTDAGYSRKEKSRTPSSDFYESHKFQQIQSWNHGRVPEPQDWRTWQSPAYTRTLPLHALKKIALIEREFKATQVVFLVTDYTLAAHRTTVEKTDLRTVNPDPFLMAMIPNAAVPSGKGRFIIDVWDEPGFGIERMLK